MSKISEQFAVVLLKPEGMKHEHAIVDELLAVLKREDLQIVSESHCLFSYKNAFEFYAGHRRKWFRSKMAEQLSSTILHGFVIEGEDAIKKLRDWVGSTDPEEAKVKEPNSPRARFGIGNMKVLGIIRKVVDNAIHITGDPTDKDREEQCLRKASR